MTLGIGKEKIMASMTKEQAVETLREMYDDLPLIDRLGKRGEALTSAIVQLREANEDA